MAVLSECRRYRDSRSLLKETNEMIERVAEPRVHLQYKSGGVTAGEISAVKLLGIYARLENKTKMLYSAVKTSAFKTITCTPPR